MKNVTKFFAVTLIILATFSPKVYAYTAFVGADPNLSQYYNTTYYVKNALNSKGYSIDLHIYDYTKDVMLNRLSYAHVVYWNGHGYNYNGSTCTCDKNGNQAFIGFKNTIKADWNQTVFDKTVFEDLANGKTVNDSVWDARSNTDITNYTIYGNYSATLR